MPTPYTTQCTATNKRTGTRCKRLVVGGGVCYLHGGNAPQVRRKREARVAAAQLAAEAERIGNATGTATPAEMLLGAAQTAHDVVGLLSQRAGAKPSPELLDALAPWLDRVGKLAALVVSSKADELVISQASRIADGQARVMFRAVEATVSKLNLTPDQRERVPEALRAALRALGLAPDPEGGVGGADASTGRVAPLVIAGEVER